MKESFLNTTLKFFNLTETAAMGFWIRRQSFATDFLNHEGNFDPKFEITKLLEKWHRKLKITESQMKNSVVR